jgi:hypothetical protein
MMCSMAQGIRMGVGGFCCEGESCRQIGMLWELIEGAFGISDRGEQ